MGIKMNNLKLVAYVERVKRSENKRLVGSIVIVNSELVISGDDELCYEELAYNREPNRDGDFRHYLQDILGVRHAVNNVEILGVL